MKTIKNILKKRWIIPVALLLLLFSFVSAGKTIINNDTQEEKETNIKKQVKITKINLNDSKNSFIETVGTVKAETQVDILSTSGGTLRGLYFEVGDEVPLNKTLASLHDTSVLTNLNNAKTNLSNTENSLNATDRITKEAIRQAEIGVKTAEESVNAAEIGLKTAEDNLENAKILRIKNNEDTKNSAVISYNNFLNTTFSALNSINSLIKADELEINNNQLLLDSGLGAKNLLSLRNAQSSYKAAKDSYNLAKDKKPTTENIKDSIYLIVDTLTKTETAVDDTIKLLDNSVSGQSLSQATIDSQKSTFISLRATVINALSSAKAKEQGLENLGLTENQEITAFENAVSAAKTQLAIAQTSFDNALVALENAKQGREQQLIGSQSSLDNARGQYNLAKSSASDLYIKSPIKGTITGKYVEIGAEINPGQKIAQISQTDMLKIEINLPSEDIYRIEKNAEVIIGENPSTNSEQTMKGIISSIDPAADPITRKVKIEVLYNNGNKDLIQGTFIDVVIPAKQLQKTHSESVFIPLRTVTSTQTENFVFIVEEKIAKKRTVVTGKTEGALIEIISGLENGDILIVEGGKILEDGDEVEILNNY